MSLKPDVLEAFSRLGIDPDSDIQSATKAYKRHALLHHPDRNHGDPEATRRFQEIGAAWNICQRHFDNPTWSRTQQQSSSTKTYSFSADDDIPLDEDELYQFYMFMFSETLFNRFSRAKGQRYRYERSGRAGEGLASFSGGLAESQERQARNTERQRKENEEYEKRKRELELEIEQEECERIAEENRIKADADRRDNALQHAFRAASSGDSFAVKKAILDYDLDVNAPRKRSRQFRKQESGTPSDTLLHVVARCCDEELFMFLIERGANPDALNKNHFNPFHSAVKAGNTLIVQCILEHRTRSLDVYHPSKATSSGYTPLQLAIESGVPAVVELLVKYATTHDIDRCWKAGNISEEIKEILLKKKGFTPLASSSLASQPPAARKSQRKQEIDLQKQARIAEELERAAINRERREERKAVRLAKEQADAAAKLIQEQARQKETDELEELHRLEVNLKAQEVLTKAPEGIHSQAEADQRSVLLKKKLSQEEKENTIRLKQEESLRMHGHPKVRSEEMSSFSLSNQTDPIVDPLLANASVPSSVDPLTEESKTRRYAKLKEKRQARLANKRLKKAEQFANQTPFPNLGSQSTPNIIESLRKPMKVSEKDTERVEESRRKKEEESLRRRSEQSARDKERHRQMRQEHAVKIQAQRNSVVSNDDIPLTPVSMHAPIERRRPTNAVGVLAQSNGPPLLSPREAFPSVVEFSMPKEDIQTCIVPDDLFRDEQPIVRPPIEEEVSVHCKPNRGDGVRHFRRPFKKPRRFE